ncbi:MAG: ParB/RepB/Spo0J family partition protein [Ruminococcaceae bacterium]|nr:ParB/RepB/Spo0J family partition protein [Oscillospiraceae bacterium]
MAKKQGGLGRNFYSLLEDNSIMTENKSTERISLSKIEPRKDQPRKDFDQEALQALADSIAVHDVIQPIVVRDLGFNGAIFEDSYEIIAGERRWRAAKLAGLSDIPAVIISGDDLKVAQVSLIENMQRMDLNSIEEAMAYKVLLDKYQMTQEELSRQVGKSRSAIANTLRLLDLPEEIQMLLRDGKISMGHARALLPLMYLEDMLSIANKIQDKDLSVREVERMVKQMIAAQNHPEVEELSEEDTEKLQKKVYMKDLEQKVQTRMGRKVRITQTGRKKTVEISYEDDGDLEDLLKLLVGDDLFE